MTRRRLAPLRVPRVFPSKLRSITFTRNALRRRGYGILASSAFLFGLAMNLPIGSMPLILSAEGSSRTAVSVAMGAGMVAALATSIPIGFAVDTFGRIWTLRLAAGVGLAVLVGLALVHGAITSGFLLALRSVALGAYMTAEFAYASALATKTRAISGVATIGMIGNLTFAIGPALSIFLWQHGFGRSQYFYAMLLVILGVSSLLWMPSGFDVRARSTITQVVLRSAWLPAVGLAIAMMLQSGVNVSLAVLTFHHRGLANGALIFSATAITSFALRHPFGRLVDIIGARVIAIPTVVLQSVGALCAAGAHSLQMVIVAGLFLGAASAGFVPVVLALLFENTSQDSRGAAVGAYNLAISSGSAGGALLATASLFIGPAYPLAMSICAFVPLVALLFVLKSKTSAIGNQPRPHVSASAGEQT